MNQLYKVIGISKQAVHQYSKAQEIYHNKIEVLMLEADILRKEHPGCSVEKVYLTFNPHYSSGLEFL